MGKFTDYEDELKAVMSVTDEKDRNRWALKNRLQDEILVNWISQGCKALTVIEMKFFDLFLLHSCAYLLADSKTASMYNLQIVKLDVNNCIAIINTSSVIKRMTSRQFTAICTKNQLQVAVPTEILDREKETETVRQDELQELNAYLAEHGIKTRIEI